MTEERGEETEEEIEGREVETEEIGVNVGLEVGVIEVQGLSSTTNKIEQHLNQVYSLTLDTYSSNFPTSRSNNLLYP